MKKTSLEEIALTENDTDSYGSLFDDALAKKDEVGVSAAVREIMQLQKRYEFLGEVDEGGVKKIHLYQDHLTCRKVARGELKKLSAEKQEEFINEIKITAALEHPNIMPIYDMGLKEDNEPYFIMKLVEGDNLEQIIKKIVEKDQLYLELYPLDKRLDIFLKICDAISYAHSKGIIHLDLKPANIQIGKFGEVTVCDWGLARQEESIGESLSLKVGQLKAKLSSYTVDGYIKGTPGYMAPEQINREFGSKSVQTDVFSLGILLYELLLGQLPYKSGSLDGVLSSTLKGEIIDPAEQRKDIPSSLRAVILKAVNVTQSKRYSSVFELSDDIRFYLRGFATQAEEAGLWSLFKLLIKRHQKLLALIVVFSLILMVQLGVSYNRIQNEKQIAEKERDNASEAAAEAELARLKAEKSERQKSVLLDKLLAEKAKTEKSRIKIAELIFNRALKFRNEGEYKKAFSNALDANQLAPGDEKTELFLAGLYLAEWEFSKSKVIYGKHEFENKDFIIKKLQQLSSFPKQDVPISLILEVIEFFEDPDARLPIASLTSHFMQSCVEHLKFETRRELAEKYMSKRLKKNPLKELEDGSFSLDCSGLQFLPNLNILYDFPIKKADFSASVLKSLKDLRSWPLESLNLSYTIVNQENYFKEFKLKELYLRGTKIKGLNKINQQYLELIDLPGVHNLLEPLKNCPNLKKVIIPKSIYNTKYLDSLNLKADLEYR